MKEAEGRIARRGAVRAALKSQDHCSRRDLVEQLRWRAGVPKALCAELREMLKADAKGLTEEFPFATKHHKPNELQNSQTGTPSKLDLSGFGGLNQWKRLPFIHTRAASGARYS